MPIEIQRGRSQWFYGRLEVNGRSIHLNLNVRIEGRIPRSLVEEGDAAFERSRARAQVALERIGAELREKANAEEIYQKILKIRTGSRMGSVPLGEMAERWGKLARKRPLAFRYHLQCTSHFARFIEFLAARYPSIREMADVQEPIAQAFLRSEEDRGVGGKTYNDVLKLFRSCFHRLKREAGITENPFVGLPSKDEDTIHRAPFSGEELDAILVGAKEDPFIYPLIVVAVSTAMRLGDCAGIRWEQVDLTGGFVSVKTSKTKKLVTIPIFARLRETLASRAVQQSGFIFPELEKQYAIAPDVLTKRVRKVMRSVGFGDAGDLKDGEQSRGAFHQERAGGLRRASIRDIHSFRTTWVTLALNAGVSMDLVQKVTGHQTVAIVTKHYHKPGQDDFRRELEKKLPSALTGKPAKAVLGTDDIRAKLISMTSADWKSIRDELLSALPGD
jgi:integrase